MSHPSEAIRPPARSGALLVPIWGYRFVSQFLEFGLPTLMAPGNLPAAARTLPFRVVALTSEDDKPLLLAHPAWRRLQKICAADIELIDDLITESNHSATMTLALARAIRSYGSEMVDTCFISWMSDYVSADGSLAAVLRGLQNGASGVFAGNFQIVAEDAIPSLRRSIDPHSSVISVSNRDLLAWSLDYLHAATIANCVNAGLSHNSYTDRLFWRVDEATLIGRFYLMHPIGVRPEVTDFEIGSSFDYSFIPEMCPSGRILTLTDSDEYFVVEMQKRDHEQRNLIPGPLGELELADGLSEWTTAQHRENAAQTVVFHAGDVPANLGDILAEADRYIAGVGRLLSPQPQPCRGHHYWVGSIAVNRARTGRALNREDWRFLLEEKRPLGGLARLLSWWRRKTMGTLPEGTRLNPRWPDYRALLDVLTKTVAGGRRLLLVADDPAVFAHWLTSSPGDAVTLEIHRVLSASPAVFQSLFQAHLSGFTDCVVLLQEAQFHHAGILLDRLAPLLTAKGEISIVAMNERPISVARGFVQTFARHSSQLLDLSMWVVDAQYVPASRLRWRTYRAFKWFSDKLSQTRWNLPILLGFSLCAVPLALASCLANGAGKTVRLPAPLCSSIIVRLRRFGLSPPGARPRDLRIGSGLIEPTESVSSAPTPAEARGETSNASLVAKYRFVSGLLDRRADVAAYGCIGDFGSKMVLEKVRKLSVYGPDLSRIGELSRELSDPWRCNAQVHDILESPLPVVHDAIYSLDTFEYISPSDEDRYLEHLSRSLSRPQDILIIGTAPCTGDDNVAIDAHRVPIANGMTPSQIDRGPPARHRRTGASLKALLEIHFRTVSLFSMTAGVVQAGIDDTGDYLFAICSSKKT